MVSDRRPLAATLVLLYLLSSLPAGEPDLESDRAALLALRAAVGRSAPALAEWKPSTNPCSWPRVTCESGLVTELHLPGAGLIGQIPAGALGNLTGLRLLSLRLNALSSPLPPDLAECFELRNLYLQGNRFSGEIPNSLFKLKKLVRLNLAGNQFSGGIPAGFNNLTRLATLYLESNHLSGEIPDLGLPGLVYFNVSYNPLNGSIPARLRSMPSDAFLGTSLCGSPLAPCPGEITSPQAPAGTKKRNLSGGAIAGITIGAAVVFLILTILLLVLCQRMRISRKTGSAEEVALRDRRMAADGMQPQPMPAVSAVGYKMRLVFFTRGPSGYDLEDLLRASAEVLGKGTIGMVYKAVLENGTVMAVKRIKDVVISEREFRERMEAIGAMRHPNLVSLQAYYYSRDDKLLVYDYMSMGSLSSLLHGNRGPSRIPLSWEARTVIALAVACGVAYIHLTSPKASHGSIKSSNVLLSGSCDDVRISDHGLTQLMGPTSVRNCATSYRAPEVTDIRRVSQKADVFSFGVLLLELLTGKAPSQEILNEGGIDLPRWVKSVVEEEWTTEVFDLELLRYSGSEEEMVQMLRLAIDCVGKSPDRRPPMPEVVARIEEIHRSILASAERVRQQQVEEGDDDPSSPLTQLC